MTRNIQALPSSQARSLKQRKPSEIMRLTSRRAALWREAERLDGKPNCTHRQEEILAEDHAIMDRLSFLKPKTPGEINAMLQALAFHIDYLANGEIELEDEDARDDRQAKATRIINAVRAALPGLE